MVNTLFITGFVADTNIRRRNLFRLEIVFGNKVFRDRTTHQTGKNQTECGTGNTNFHGITDAIVLGNSRRPGNRRTVPANQRNCTAKHAYRSG